MPFEQIYNSRFFDPPAMILDGILLLIDPAGLNRNEFDTLMDI